MHYTFRLTRGTIIKTKPAKVTVDHVGWINLSSASTCGLIQLERDLTHYVTGFVGISIAHGGYLVDSHESSSFALAGGDK